MTEKKIIMVLAAVVVVVMGIILTKEFISSKYQPADVAADQDKTEPTAPVDQQQTQSPSEKTTVSSTEDVRSKSQKNAVRSVTPGKFMLRSNQLLTAMRDNLAKAKTEPASYETVVEFGRKIIRENPVSDDAEAARAILRDIPPEYLEKYNVTNRELGLPEE